jgi:hypothetical protein
MINCQGLDSTKLSALDNLLQLLLGLMSKGAFPSELLDDILAFLTDLLLSKFKAGANGSDINDLLKKYLDAAINHAYQVNGNGSGSNNNSNTDGTDDTYDPVTGKKKKSAKKTKYKFPFNGKYTRGIFGGNVDLSLKSGILANPDEPYTGFFNPNNTNPPKGNDGTDTIPPYNDGSNANDPTKYVASDNVAVKGTPITAAELADYFNGIIPQDNDEFAILLWLKKGLNPMLLLTELSYAKTLHNNVVRTAANHYKNIIYGDPTYPTRLGWLNYGIVSKDIVHRELRGGPTSRHVVGQACNFGVISVEPGKIIEDIINGIIECDYGTIALTSNVNVTLPFYAANGQIVRHMLLWSNSGIPGFIGYQFNK